MTTIPTAPDAEVVRRLRAVVGSANVLTDPDVLEPYLTDWTRRYRGAAIAVIRPTSTDEVSNIVKECARLRIPIVPQGGNTGLVAGSVPKAGSVLLSTTRLLDIGPVDRESSQLTVAAGVTLSRVQETATAAGLRFPVDLAARGSATIGGMVATNAGGLSVLRFGPMRSQLAGLEAVLADGSVISHLGGLVKDNTGYDLCGLLCGSEGTLGIVTAVRLRLVPADAGRLTFVVGLDAISVALRLLNTLRARAVVVESAELIRRAGVEMVGSHLGRTPPPALLRRFALLVEVVASPSTVSIVAEVLDDGELCDVVVAESSSSAAELWAWRERHTESISARGVPIKLDVSLPAGELEAFESDIDGVIAAVLPSAEVHVFGHLGDGNLHVNVLGVDFDDQSLVSDVEGAILRRVVVVNGSISAEHGIGTMKTRWLHLNRSPAELRAMRMIKAALDPTALFNPGVLLPS